MAKQRGNPNWGKPNFVRASPSTMSKFERVARQLKLKPDQYLDSARLREWAKLNRHSKYVPESLLTAWGLGVAVALDRLSPEPDRGDEAGGDQQCAVLTLFVHAGKHRRR